jgi:ribonuclease HI
MHEPLYMKVRRQLPAWRAAGASPQVLEWIREGARCDWITGPPPPYHHGVSLAGPDDLSEQQSAFLEKEVARCFATGAWEAAPEDERSHICRVHLVPKKTPPGEPQKWRVVVDLRPTNAYCKEKSCKYETLKVLQRLARRGDWMISFDMQDGYHCVAIAEDHRRYMTFALPPPPGSPPGTPPRYIRCAALPFGWSASPLIFTKAMRVMVRMLRAPKAATFSRLRRATAAGRAAVLRLGRRGDPWARGMRCLAYVDDFLCLARTRREALRCRDRIAYVLARLGLTRHPEKGYWEPTQRLEHLGMDVDTAEGLFRVPPAKLAGLMQQAGAILAIASRDRRLVSVRTLASFVGYAQSVELACPAARFYLRALHDVMATRRDWQDSVRLSRQALRDLRWWRKVGAADVSRAIWRAPTDRTLHTDASRLAWGGVLDGTVPAQGMWRGRDRGRHINYLELMAVYLSLQRFEGELQGASVLLWEDNTTVVHVLTSRTSRSPELMHLLRKVWRLLDTAGIQLTVRWIASKDNALADALSRGSPFDDLTITDEAWIELDARWGPHTIDRYATAATARTSAFNSLLPEAGSAGAAALAQDWTGQNNYVFAPVTELPRVAQLLHERPLLEATLVVPHWPAQAWWQQLAEIAVHVEVRALASVARPAAWLPSSARTALSGAMLTFIRVAGHRDGSTVGV